MPTEFSRSDDLRGARFTNVNLRGARFDGVDLSGAMIRGSDIAGGEIDSPWLIESRDPLWVNGVDVTPFVDAELDRRFPGRSQRRAGDPESLRAAWSVLQETWAATVSRAEAMPAGTVDIRIDDEWSFAETLRHLVLATDIWLGKAALGLEQPYHRFGLTNAGAGDEGFDMSVFAADPPTWAQVLETRADRVGMVTAYLGDVTAEQLAEPRQNPWAPQHQESVLSCLHTVLEEEWEHHRYAVRDLDKIASGVA
ncbi:DinB family protein [Nakamurella sp. YIM 132087]|uniref:DinB family protein n=1 Tax=Nakamurella alba TaxID=2665158 RepID=A0A7K1FHF0_9ACTN|nr:DinB family protein [Nakamurella alba]MTD13557.1 DinB family protein [Nakamurella alba]